MVARNSVPRNSIRRRRRGAALTLTVVLLASLAVPRLLGDDRELLRKNGGDPYLFVLLDSSMSMTLALDDTWVEANGDDPRSRIYQAKEVLYDELSTLDGVRFGFATFNQDQLRIQSKHFLYYLETDQLAKVTALGIGYPTVEADVTAPFGGDDVVEYQTIDAQGNKDTVVDIDGDMMTFGQTFGGSSSKGKACNDPLSLATDRERINRFSKLGVDGKTVTSIWVVDGAGTRYLLTFDGNPGLAKPGATTMEVTITVTPDRGCDGVDPDSRTERLTFTKWREFLMTDDGSGEVVFAQSGLGVGNTGPEKTGGFAEWRDAQGLFDCGESKPFSGGGWEGNYDTGISLSTRPAYEQSLAGFNPDLVDEHCAVPGPPPSGCKLLQFDTTYEPNPGPRELDRGDVLPFHWNFDNKDAFLKRLNPNHGSGLPEFGAAAFFKDVPDASGRLELKEDDRVPIVPAGPSPISDAILDFRCWYLGTNNKCGRGNLEDIYTKGFMKLLEEEDPGAFDCRQPFLIVITDMALNCPGNSTVANAAGMNSDSGGGSVGVSTWIFNVGTRKVTGLTNAGKGEEIKIDTKAKLRTELQKVLGIIEESSRSFASAAVPSVQADVEDKIYITQFTPRQEASVWEGHVHAFLKPLPTVAVDPTDPAKGFRPDTDHPNHQWDGAEVLLTTQAPTRASLTVPLDRAELRLGANANQRRFFYAIGDTDPATDADGDTFTDNDVDTQVPRTRAVFGPFTSAGDNPTTNMDLNQLRKDLWLGMGIVDEAFTFTNTADDVTDLFAKHTAKATEAHSVFLNTYAIRVVQPRDENGNAVGSPVEYLLGDIFHATPQLVGNPANGRYLARPDSFPGYEEYFQVQARRRKVLYIASDDGQLHAFDAGRFARTDNVQEDPNVSVEDGRFNNGTGTELFAYTPRVLLERLKTLADSTIGHEWGVDGTPAVTDARIDPIHRGVGSLDPPKEADRQWRTVLVGGLRRGGKGYYALDVTRPDKMIEEKKNIGGTDVTLGWKPQSPIQVVPGCLQAAGNAATTGDCDPSGLDYPAVLWELTDPDLGETWSSPDMGAIEVIENGTTVIKYVAVFGGGMDPGGFLRESDVTQGRMLYMVDVETGNILYKRQLEGAVPSAPAAVDTDQDGLLDRIYVGTTEGLMYRVNISTPQDLKFAAACTATPPVDSTDRCCAGAGGPTHGCVNDPAWEPFVLFDTASDSTPGDGTFTADLATRKPIFFRPSVIFSSQLGRYALGFGTGNRENLWAREQASGNRFYLFVDDSDVIDPALLPRFEDDYEEVTTQEGLGQDLLQDPADGFRGWFVRLGTVPSPSGIDVTHEKALTPTTAISGLSVFSTFVPETTVSQSGSGNNATIQCARRGISRVFTQFTANGEEVPVPDAQGNPPPACATPPCTRTPDEISTLVSEPFIEQADAPCAGTEGMAELLKQRIFPPTCNFASYRWNLSAMRSDTGVECLAQIPVCIIEKNWKDF